MGSGSLMKLFFIPLFVVMIAFIIYSSYQWGKSSCIAEGYELNIKNNREMSIKMEQYNAINYPNAQQEIDEANDEYRREYEDYVSKNAGVVRNINIDKLHELPSKDLHFDKHSVIDVESDKTKSS